MRLKGKKFIAVATTISMLAMLAGCGASEGNTATDAQAAADGEIGEYHFVMAEVNPIDTIVGQTDKAFADKVEELSNGTMTVELHCDAELGTEIDVVTGMIDGDSDVDICRTSAFQFNNFGCHMPLVLSLPFTFENEEHFWKFADSDLAKEFLDEPLEYNLGVRGLFFGEEGFRHFFSDKPINGIDDLNGMRIRVSSDEVMTGMVVSLGGTAYQIQMNEIPSSFYNDEIDAAEQPIVNYAANNFNEEAPYMLLDGHTLGVIEVFIKDDVWQELTPAQQAVIAEAAEYAKECNKGLVSVKEEETIKSLTEQGVTFTEVADKTPYREAVKDLIKKQIVGREDLYQQVLDFAK